MNDPNPAVIPVCARNVRTRTPHGPRRPSHSSSVKTIIVRLGGHLQPKPVRIARRATPGTLVCQPGQNPATSITPTQATALTANVSTVTAVLDQKLTALNSIDPNLAPFKKAGGKMI